MSALSAAIPITNRMRTAVINNFTDATAAAISMAFLAFVSLALSAIVSGYKLSKQTYMWWCESSCRRVKLLHESFILEKQSVRCPSCTRRCYALCDCCRLLVASTFVHTWSIPWYMLILHVLCYIQDSKNISLLSHDWELLVLKISRCRTVCLLFKVEKRDRKSVV